MTARTLRAWAVIAACAGIALATSGQVDPADLEALKAQLHQAQEMLQAQQTLIESLQRRLADLEAKQPGPAASKASETPPTSAAADAKPAPQVPAITWKNGVTTLAFQGAALKLDNRLQFRWTGDEDGDPSKRDSGAFRIRRFKTRIQGWAYRPELTFRLQADWANANTSLGVLDDACVNYDFTKGKGHFQLKAGQFKTPMGRQSIATTASDMFADRSFVTTTFCNIRDVGLMAWGQAGPKKAPDLFEYYVGIFNGGGRSEYANADGRYQTNFRFVVSPLGNPGYDEASPAGSPTPKLALGYDYEHNDRREDPSGWMAGRVYTTQGCDLLFRYRRFTAYGEYFDRKASNAKGLRTDSSGLNAQFGFLLFENRCEAFLGYWAYDPNAHLAGDRQTERGVGANWYFHGFSSKLQADYRRISGQAPGYRTREVRLQYQIVF